MDEAEESEALDKQEAILDKEPRIMTELEDLNFEHARVLAFYEIKTEFSTNFVMIA